MSVYIETATAQFENANSLRDYPFADGCSLVDDSGKAMSKNVIVDLHMLVPSDIVTFAPRVRLSSLHLSQSMISACFVSEILGKTSALSVNVAISNFSPYVPYRLDKLHGSEDVGGIVTFGDMELPGYPETYRFGTDNRNAEIHPCCVATASPARLRSFVDMRSGAKLSGDVNIEFSGYVDSSRSGNSVRLDLSEGAESQLMSKCAGLRQGLDICGATPIRSINGIRPDEDGNIVLWFH